MLAYLFYFVTCQITALVNYLPSSKYMSYADEDQWLVKVLNWYIIEYSVSWPVVLWYCLHGSAVWSIHNLIQISESRQEFALFGNTCSWAKISLYKCIICETERADKHWTSVLQSHLKMKACKRSIQQQLVVGLPNHSRQILYWSWLNLLHVTCHLDLLHDLSPRCVTWPVT